MAKEIHPDSFADETLSHLKFHFRSIFILSETRGEIPPVAMQM